MIKRIFLAIVVLVAAMEVNCKTLVVYYSFTNNVHTIVTDLLTQIEADVVRVEPAEKGFDYAANGYEEGSALISTIRKNPTEASSYPSIDPVKVNMSDYDMVIVAVPLWWNNMAAPLQSFLFQYGGQMAGKRIGLIVSSASSGISDVVADAKRLIPKGDFLSKNLWIRSSQVSNCHQLTAKWLSDIDYRNIASGISSAGDELSPRVLLSHTGANVVGKFDSLAIFNAFGERLLHTSSSSSSYPFKEGCYIARIQKGTRTWTVKKMVDKM